MAAMIKFIGTQENSQQEILKTFKEDKDARATRGTNPKTSAEDKTKEAKTEQRIQGLEEFRTFTDKLSFATSHYKRDDYRRILDNTNVFHIKGLTEILRYFNGDQYVDEEIELKKMKRPKMMDAITLAIIKQFPRPCLACGCFLEQPLMTSREHKEKPTCQICGDYLYESCQDRTGVD